jgi:hypothetical protein
MIAESLGCFVCQVKFADLTRSAPPFFIHNISHRATPLRRPIGLYLMVGLKDSARDRRECDIRQNSCVVPLSVLWAYTHIVIANVNLSAVELPVSLRNRNAV